jgi:DNA modification methylase
MGEIKLYNADMFDILPKIEDKSVNMIFADFPYGTTKASWDSLIDLSTFWVEANRILKDNGLVVATAQFPFTATLAMSNISNLRYEWIWEKTQATGYLNSKRMPMKSHENILVFYNKLPTYNPQMTSGHVRKVSSAKNRAACIERRNNTDNIYGNEYSDKVKDYDSTERYPRDVIKFASDKQKSTLHKTQKPISLLEYLIKTYTNEGDVILDPCFGSNTTGLVCKNTNRNYIGIEKDINFFNIGSERVK